MPKIVPDDAVLIPKQAEEVFSGVIYDVFQWQQALFDGSQATFEMLRRPDTVQAIAIVDGKVIVLADEQPHRGIKMSLPGGRVNQGEDTLVAAKRELAEETGIELSRWRLVDVTQPFFKIEWFVYTYVACGKLSQNEANSDSGENITINFDDFNSFKSRCSNFEGFLGDLLPVIKNIENIEQLEAMPEFKGIDLS